MTGLFSKHYFSVLMILFISMLCPGSLSVAFERIPGVIHLDTNISDGTLSPEEMVKQADEKGLQFAVTTDKDNLRVEYGIAPLRNVIRKIEQRPSVRTYGARQYLELLDRLGKKYPGVTTFAGIEAIPFYYWEGNYFDNNLKLRNFHKHVLIIGLERPEDIAGIPSVHYNNPLQFNISGFLRAWPLFFIPAGIWLLMQKKAKHIKMMGLVVTKKVRLYLVPGIAVLLAGIIFTLNNFPFFPHLYDQYHGDRGPLPYQNLIDYVNKRGGMLFWAHPEDPGKYKEYGIDLETAPYHNELLRTENYTGFAALLEGMRYTGNPGGVWDRVLKEYADGKRKKPAWAIGEMNYQDGDWMGEIQTVVLAGKNNRKEILDAMREGRMYAVSGPQKPVLETFHVWDDKKNNWTEMGGTATVRGKIRIKIGVSLPDENKGTMKLKMIREGIVIKEFDLGKHFDMEWVDEYFKANTMTYYRLDIDGRLISNPIFVKMEQT